MIRKYLPWIIAALVVGFLAMVLRPVPMVEAKDAIMVEGTLVGVRGDDNFDVWFTLKGNDRRYYVNRGMEAGLNADTLAAKYVGSHTRLYYPEYWTPLDPSNSIRHLSKVEIGDEVIFNELR